MSFLDQQALKASESERLELFVSSLDHIPYHVDDWEPHLKAIYPQHLGKDFAFFHREMWAWVFANIWSEEVSPAFLAIWARGAGKSTNAEIATAEFGASGTRKYCWYVRETQDQADKSIDNIAAVLESQTIEANYPGMSDRAVSKYGKPQGWRRNRLITASGFTVDGLGLDKAVRGVKSKEARPDLIIVDDIDGRHDTIATTTKKIETLTDSIFQAGASNVLILFIQNLIIPDGVMAQLVDGRAGFLLDKIVSGPFPAVEGLTYEQTKVGTYTVTGGEPTWPDGQGLDVVEAQINKVGPTSFLREGQHEVDKTGGFYDHIEFRYIERAFVPDIVKYAVWCDPAVTTTDKSDSMAIQADGIDEKGIIYRFFSFEQITTPEDILRRAILKAVELGCISVGVETDQGGDTWKSVYARAVERLIKDEIIKVEIKNEDGEITQKADVIPSFKQDKAGAGHGSKVHRGQQMLADYEAGQIVHVKGTHTALEKSLMRFPNKPLDLADAAYWSWHDLRNRITPSKLVSFVEVA